MLKTLVTFLMATPSPVWLLVAALREWVSTTHDTYMCRRESGKDKKKMKHGLLVPNDSVGALAQLLCHIVPFVDDELLVEDLEHFAACEVGHGGGGDSDDDDDDGGGEGSRMAVELKRESEAKHGSLQAAGRSDNYQVSKARRHRTRGRERERERERERDVYNITTGDASKAGTSLILEYGVYCVLCTV